MEATTALKKTALTHAHESLGAKMVPFAGYLMPVQYTGVNDEHHTVRNNVGVFDVSHMGEFIVRGPGAADRVIALDMLGLIGVAAAGLAALVRGHGHSRHGRGRLAELGLHRSRGRHRARARGARSPEAAGLREPHRRASGPFRRGDSG